MFAKNRVKIGSKIITVAHNKFYYSIVYQIKKPKIQGLHFDTIVIDEASEVSDKDFNLLTNKN